MMIAPYIPLPMWCSAGAVPQWYMNAPANCASNSYTNDSPGRIVRISSFHATLLAWKSIEWPISPLLVSVMRKVSPTLPCSIGPGTWSLNVHISCVTPGATSTSVSVASNAISCTVPAAFAGSTGSRPRQSVPGIAAPSIVAFGEPTTVVAVSAPSAAPTTCTAIYMPPSLWPGTVHHTVASLVNGPITTSAFWPAFNIAVPVAPSTLKS